MPTLQVKDHIRPVIHSQDIVASLASLSSHSSLEEELDAMIEAVQALDVERPDVIMSTCMSLMARCVELHVKLVRIEGENRKAKYFRVTQLQKVMELIDFEFKGASRLIEVRRQEVELSR